MDTTPVTPARHTLQEAMEYLADGDLSQAESKFREALKQDAYDTEALHGLGIVAHRTGRYEAALGIFDQVLEARPDYAATWVNRGNTLARLRRFEAAVKSYSQALAISPELISAQVNLSTTLSALGQLDSAVEAMERARRVIPSSPDILNNLGNLYKDQGRLVEALACYEAALQFNPMMQQAFSNKLAALKLDSLATPEQILQQHRLWAAWFEAVNAEAPLLANSIDCERRVRIGYVSPDCHGAVPAFIDPIISGHDRARFDVYCYFNNPQDDSKLVALNAKQNSRVLQGLDDSQVAKLVRDDDIDILVDIAGHTGNNRLGVFARRPAPVQITWLDYLCTTGLDAMDYRLTDRVADPPGNEAFHSERLLRMPAGQTQWCWQPDANAPEVASLPFDRNGHLTIGSFNHAQKLTDATLNLWKRLLDTAVNSKLRVCGVSEGASRDRILAGLGGNHERVEFVGRMSPSDYRRLFADVDISLDPMPFSGATTTLDALWQGVPVLTLPQTRSCSRSAASLLSAIGLTDWIAKDEEDFLSRAVCLLSDIDGLRELRQRLRLMVGASAIVRTREFVRDLETLYREAWRTWCEQRTEAAARPTVFAGTHDAILAARSANDSGRSDDAMDILVPLIRTRPNWDVAKRELARASLAWGQAHPEARAAWASPVEGTALERTVSVVICSNRPEYFSRLMRQLNEQFAFGRLEVIGIGDARSLGEGYNRGAARATGDVLVFCHDDIQLVQRDFGQRLLRHLSAHDMVGVAGTSRLVSGNWTHAGPPHMHGQIIIRPPGENGYVYSCEGLHGSFDGEIQALDGVLIATHRHVWQGLKFDETTFDGFDLHDIDFSYRAFLSGYRLGVPLDLVLIHFSTGPKDNPIRHAYAQRFLSKFPNLGNWPSALRRANLQVRVPTLGHMERIHAALLRHHFGAARDTEVLV